MDSLRRKYKMSLLLITHDLGIVKKIADRVCVMEKGIIVEQNTKLALKTAHRGYVLELGSVRLEGTVSQLAADKILAEAYLGESF